MLALPNRGVPFCRLAGAVKFIPLTPRAERGWLADMLPRRRPLRDSTSAKRLALGIKMNDGKQLEALVAFVEQAMLPDGFDVKTNQRIYNDDGVQIAEFDVEIRGKLGTTEVAWLIECRDRPGSGPAPGSWVEQLVGRRSRFGFNKVTAVSTTGFAEGAREFAQLQGIELRVVEALTPDAFSWLQTAHMSVVEQRTHLKGANILVNANTPEDVRAALRQVVVSADGGSAKILRSIRTGESSTVANAFLGAVVEKRLFNDMDIQPNAPGKRVTLRVQYINDEDHFVVDTALGEVRVEVIVFHGELTAVETLVPIDAATKYRNLETGDTISQVASFAPHDVAGTQVALEFHRMGEDGETYVVLRKAKSDS